MPQVPLLALLTLDALLTATPAMTLACASLLLATWLIAMATFVDGSNTHILPCCVLQIPVPTTISKSYTIHTDSIKPHHVFKSIAALLSDDPTKHPKKKIWTPIPTPTPVPTPVPVPMPVSGPCIQLCLFA